MPTLHPRSYSQDSKSMDPTWGKSKLLTYDDTEVDESEELHPRRKIYEVLYIGETKRTLILRFGEHN